MTGTIDRAADRSPAQRSPHAGTRVVIAAYNEADRIGATLAALGGAFPGAPLWVADDGSSDGTREIAERMQARVVRSERVIGKGAAMTAAARAALDDAHAQAGATGVGAGGGGERQGAGAVFILCDGDLAGSASALAALTAPIASGEADVTVARFVRRVGGGFGLALGFARWAIERRCGFVAEAPISGQRALSARALADVLPFAAGYGMEVGMTIDAVRAGHRVLEVELDLSHRASGRTLSGFAHRGRQLIDFARVYRARA